MPEGKLAVRFASPEDTLLHKLVWYKLGNEISDRQWGDILGVLRVPPLNGSIVGRSASRFNGALPMSLRQSILLP